MRISHQGENKLVKKNGYMIERHILKVDGLGLLVVKKKRLESYDIELTSELWRFQDRALSRTVQIDEWPPASSGETVHNDSWSSTYDS